MRVLSGPVEDFFETPIPQEVWHYTTLVGFEGILSSGKVWATEAHFTNDASELVHAREVAVGILDGISPTDDNAALAKAAGLDMVNSAFDKGELSPELTEVYIASFSAARDLKSQWIEYADRGRGVSLAFDLREIRPPHSLNFGITVAPCLYSKEKKEEILKAGLGHYCEAVAELYRQTKDRKWVLEQWKTWNVIQSIYGFGPDRSAFEQNLGEKHYAILREKRLRSAFDLLRLASHCKDYSFNQEQEWRLALPRSKSKPLVHSEIQYRGPHHDIPYIAHDLFQENKRLPITGVMIGPCSNDQDQIMKTLANCNYDVPVTRSAIPLRDPGK